MTLQNEQGTAGWTAEATFKAAVLTKLRQLSRLTANSRIASEFVFGATGVRADLAVFGRELVGVEIKTDRDSLRRLSRQIRAYNLHCHRTVLAVAPKHVVPALQLVGDQVDLWTVRYGKIEAVRSTPGSFNPDPDIESLLTQAERLRVRNQAELSRTNRKRQAIVLATLGQRFSSTSAEFMGQISGRSIKPDDIALLSRFRGLREEAAAAKQSAELAWESWEAQAAAIFGSKAPA